MWVFISEPPKAFPIKLPPKDIVIKPAVAVEMYIFSQE